jgi:hypothetical protein
MIIFSRRSFIDRLLRVIPSYRRKQDEALRDAIKLLMDNPDMPCIIGGEIVPNGYGDYRPLIGKEGL